ncbi:aarF domain-containing kinase 1 [Pararge aegeria]|uniref:Jg8269 protein n=2 Tax=Pararge aegeria TaxID=116150 RepID=A0A8S4RGA5_9NEOP|nr:aarF domain-containing kinase 1 [Pararge aegeria]CAH2235282.1 jg8269 [Pararge aegeria aegeria]
MMSRNLSRILKFSLFGGVTIGSGFVALKYHDADSLAIVRLSRTAYTAVDIGRTYQSMLYSKEWDKSSKEYLTLKSEAHQIGAEKLLKLCKANKGVYIKVGQHVGALDYLLPNEYVQTMRILHKDAPKNTVEELYDVIRQDLKQDPEELFDEFDPEPLGTASLAQVHRAKLKDGSEVAVKVQHHFVRKNTNFDLKWMEFIINTMTRVFPDFQMQWLIEETKKNIAKELDFLQEGKNAEKVAEMFKNYTWLKVPKIYWNYSTERVLVMEYVNGGQVNDVNYIDKHKISRPDLCTKLGDLYSHMIFVTGFVHSDPHPGNILVKKDPQDKDVTVYLLDHGLYAQLSEKFRYHYSKLWLSIIARDKDQMRDHAEQLGIENHLYGLFACMVTGRPWDVIEKGIDRTKPSSVEKSTFQNELPNFLHYVTHCLEHVDRQALLVLKTNDLIRSIEYALGMQERMCGFMVMSKCCTESIYKLEFKKERSLLKRQFLNTKYVWSLFVLYIYGIYLSLRMKFNISS